MSVFRVDVNNAGQGLLDVDVNGKQFATSHQRSIYAIGPRNVHRLLKDGDTFTDCNYWKRFAYPNVPLDQAFITVVTDDGGIWSDTIEENTFPAMTTLTCVALTSYATNTFDILGTYGSPAVFTQITNSSSTGSVSVRLNGLTTATFTLAHGVTQIYNHGDLLVTKIQVDNTSSGANPATVDIQVAIKSQANS